MAPHNMCFDEKTSKNDFKKITSYLELLMQRGTGPDQPALTNKLQICLIFFMKTSLGYSLELPHRLGPNELAKKKFLIRKYEKQMHK